MEKILLINPPSFNKPRSGFPNFIDKQIGAYPSLGLMYISSYLKKHKINSQILDCQFLNYSDIREKIKEINPDIVGVQVLTHTLIDSLKIARLVKTFNKKIKVVFGGRHPTLYPKETIKFKEVDYVIRGDGEVPFFNLVNGKKKIKGLVTKRKDNGIYVIEDLDSLPFPDINDLDIKKYNCLISKDNAFMTMITSRGCPHNCIFCDEGNTKYRMRSAKNVVDEIEQNVKKGIKNIFFYDSTFSINKKRVIDICYEIINRDLEVKLDIRTRVDLIDDEIFKKLKKAGCVRIQYGIESGTDKVLKNLRKNITVNKIKEVVNKTKEYGFEILADFMIGCPGETEEDIFETINFACSLPLDYVQFSNMVPLPFTDIYIKGLEEGIIKEDYWQKFAENPSEDFEPKLWEENLIDYEILELLKYAYKRFYFRPRYVLRQVFKIRSFGEFWRKFKAGISLVRNV